MAKYPSTVESGRHVWHVDSGPGSSLTGNLALFTSLFQSDELPSVMFGDGIVQRAEGRGTVELCGLGISLYQHLT